VFRLGLQHGELQISLIVLRVVRAFRLWADGVRYHGLERAPNDAAGLCLVLFMFFFRPFCMAHFLVWQVKMLRARTKNENHVHSPTSEPPTVEALWPALHRFHQS